MAERTNRSIVEMARCMLIEAGLSKAYWEDAVKAAVYLKNRSPHRSVVNVTPEEKWTGEKQNLTHLKVFGCRAFVHVVKHERDKWDPKAKEFIFVGYSESSKAYRLRELSNPRKIVEARDVTFIECGVDDEPKTFNGAISGEEEEKWLKAMNEEYNSLIANETWNLVDHPAGQKIINYKWVFKRKRNENGEITRYKARLVAKGYEQTQGIDYNEVFSPVVRYSTLRMLIALAVKKDLDIHLDVETAFLNGILEEIVYSDMSAERS